ncbi:MAG: TerB family tellurite resistance protein [Planctomycetota bacterium]
MALIGARQKKAFKGIAGSFGVEDDDWVRGVVLPVAGQAYFAALREGRWRYWVRRQGDEREPESFAQAVGRLLPMRSRDFFARLNDHVTGPIRGGFFTAPRGETFVYDLEDPRVVERFALACALAAALGGTEKLLSCHAGKYGLREEAATVLQDALPHLSANVSAWAIDAPSQSLVFLPNAVVLRRERYQWVVPYEEVALRSIIRSQPADESTPGDVGLSESGLEVTFGELRLALSDRRATLQVSNPERARRAAAALEQLLALGPRVKAPDPDAPGGEEQRRERRPPRRLSGMGASGTGASGTGASGTGASGRTPPARGERPSRRRAKTNASCGEIVIRQRVEVPADSLPITVAPRDAKPISVAARARAADAQPITVSPRGDGPRGEDAGEPALDGGSRLMIRLHASDEAPPAEPDAGLDTPTACAEEPDLGLVFCDQSPLADDEPATLPPGQGGDVEGLALRDTSPLADAGPSRAAAGSAAPGAAPATGAGAAAARADALRSAVGALLAYVAKSDQGFSEAERKVVREALQLPRGFALDGSFAAIAPGSPALARAYALLRAQDAELRARVLAECERVAWADEQLTRSEHERLGEIRRALGL